MKKTFIGFDLGDGESITDFVTLNIGEKSGSVQTVFTPMTMPGYNEPGRAIPTVFGYDQMGHLVFSKAIAMMPDMISNVRVNFKRRPSDLIPGLTESRAAALLSAFNQAKTWPTDCRDCNTSEMEEFRNAVVTFTDAVFENEAYLERVRSEAADSSEIVFSVGHPTRWNDLDVAIYKTILRGSVLGKGSYAGKSTVLNMAAESRAAYLAVRDKTTGNVLPKGTSALLIDVGSSTIDLTAVTADSHNYQYNSGNNYLGARGIDYMIVDLYLAELGKMPGAMEMYRQLSGKNPNFQNSVVLACRLAKEEMYSSGIGMAQVSLGGMIPVRILQADVDNAAASKPIADALSKHIPLPEEQARRMAGKSWTQAFEEFLREQRAEIAKREIKIGRIILTGSASKMPFVGAIVKKVFSDLPDGEVLLDMDPSRSISMGLALVGPSNEKSIAFQKDLMKLLDEELPEIISQSLPKLADDLSTVINKVMNGIVMNRMHQWRSGSIRTLNDMSALIKSDCSSEKLQELLMNNKEYTNTISVWMTDVVGVEIAVKLKDICARYGVKEFSLDDLNIMKAPKVDIGSVNVDVLDFMNVIIGLVAVIAGIITYIVLPSVLAVVIVLIAMISTTIAGILLAILLAIPGPGWVLLTAIGGVAIFNAVRKGLGGAKEALMEKIKDFDLPQWIRDRMTDEKIEKEMAKNDMASQVRTEILKDESKADITQAVMDNLRSQIEKRAEDIKYVIESK